MSDRDQKSPTPSASDDEFDYPDPTLRDETRWIRGTLDNIQEVLTFDRVYAEMSATREIAELSAANVDALWWSIADLKKLTRGMLEVLRELDDIHSIATGERECSSGNLFEEALRWADEADTEFDLACVKANDSLAKSDFSGAAEYAHKACLRIRGKLGARLTQLVDDFKAKSPPPTQPTKVWRPPTAAVGDFSNLTIDEKVEVTRSRDPSCVDPGWSIEQWVETINCHRSSLYNSEKFKAIRRFQKLPAGGDVPSVVRRGRGARRKRHVSGFGGNTVEETDFACETSFGFGSGKRKPAESDDGSPGAKPAAPGDRPD